ncbi:MAG: hypothetical protein J6C67_01755 [Muribaculaceae bacterium]|nr:hypothetical protein [Muribaculaceae bacterium]
MMNDNNIDKHKNERAEAKVTPARSPLLAWVAVGLTLAAWATLIWLDGYAAMAVAAAAVVVGFLAVSGRSTPVKNLAITAIIAATVLLVVLAAFLIVIKIGLGE